MSSSMLESIYKKGIKWCSTCEEKKETNEKYCNVCGKQLRNNPRSKRKRKID